MKGADYDEIFCPVVGMSHCKCWLKLHQVDVITAFLNKTLEEEVFVKQPKVL